MVKKTVRTGFTRFVQLGRVCMVSYGPDEGKLCTIIDVVDNNKALVDGPKSVTGVDRQIIPFKRLLLTDFKINVLKNPKAKTLTKAFKSADIETKWSKTSYAMKRAARAKRAAMNDFDRFKLTQARKKKAKAVGSALKAVTKSA